MKKVVKGSLKSSGWMLILFATVCNADTIAVDLMSPLLSGSPGSAITFGGTLANTTTSTVFLNSAGINLLGGFSPADEDTGPFFINAPLFLGAGESTAMINLFTVNIPSLPDGPYLGTFTMLGGADENAFDIVGSATFTLQVNSTVPEPNTTILMASIVAVIYLRHAMFRSRRSTTQ